MPTIPLLTFPWLPDARRVQSLLLLLVPHGGQQQARRNAWVGMSAGASRGRDRRLAEEALHGAEQRAYARAALGGGTGT